MNNKRLAEAETIYGSFKINTQQDFIAGHRLFTQAVSHSPRDIQYRLNLINLLIFLGEVDEAEHQLGLFRTDQTHGGNESIYQALQDSIDEVRQQKTTAVRLETPTGDKVH